MFSVSVSVSAAAVKKEKSFFLDLLFLSLLVRNIPIFVGFVGVGVGPDFRSELRPKPRDA